MKMPSPWSPLAVRSRHPRDVRGERETAGGILIHTTGAGVVEKTAPADEARLYDPFHGGRALDRALMLYTTAGEPFAHYVVGWEGECVQVSSEAEPAWEAGWDAGDRAAYAVPCPEAGPLAWWFRRWESYLVARGRSASVRDLVRLAGGETPNAVYIGIEFLWHPGGVTPAQYGFGGALVADIAQRRKMTIEPATDTFRCATFLGHEDVEPRTRSTPKGGPWDPGGQVDFRRLWEEANR